MSKHGGARRAGGIARHGGHSGRRLRLLALAALVLLPFHASFACESAVLLFPAVQAVVTAAQPVLRWRAVTAATGYRLRVASRVPEGRALERIDVRVTRPEFALAHATRGEPRVKLRLELETECGAQLSAVTAIDFMLENPALCKLASDAGVSRLAAGLRWTALPASQAYDVCVASGTAVPLCTRTATAQLTLPPQTGTPLLLSIAPVCDGVPGEPHYAAIPGTSIRRDH